MLGATHVPNIPLTILGFENIDLNFIIRVKNGEIIFGHEGMFNMSLIADT